MTMTEYQNRNLPEYSKTMYLEGYTPEQILTAAHRDMIDRLLTQQEEETDVHITSEVKVR